MRLPRPAHLIAAATLATAAALTTPGTALAAWDATTDDAPAAARATVLPPGPAATAHAHGPTVTVTWDAATGPHDTYLVTRTDLSTGETTTACPPTTATSCADRPPATTPWSYRVTTLVGDSWRSTPGPRTAAVTTQPSTHPLTPPPTSPPPSSPTPSSPTPSSPPSSIPTPQSPAPTSPAPSSPTPTSPVPSSPTPQSPAPSSRTPQNPVSSSPTPQSPSPDQPRAVEPHPHQPGLVTPHTVEPGAVEPGPQHRPGPDRHPGDRAQRSGHPDGVHPDGIRPDGIHFGHRRSPGLAARRLPQDVRQPCSGS